MAHDQEFIDYLVDQIHDAGQIRFRHMFGGCTLYSNDKVVALICDGQVFVKPTEAGREFIGTPTEAPAYPGAKPSFLIDSGLDDHDWFSELIRVTEAALPKPRPKKKKAAKKKSAKKPK
ncbi:MAG: TfoX/Sxy family transcriptional regulator of competence genes [Glaciecola sp.]|jgi:TfoX/Sxy family transcriptional regulator of competence genes